MQSKVNIIADDMGNVIRQSSTSSEYGYVRLQQDRVTFGNGGWVKKSNISTLLHGKLEDLQSIGLESMTSVPGKIIIKEQLTPFSTNDPDRDYKMAGDTGIICCVDGEPIYRKTFYVADATSQDVLVAHNNGDAIKEANASAFNLDKSKVALPVDPVKAFGFDSDEEVVEETTNEVEEEVLEEETFDL